MKEEDEEEIVEAIDVDFSAEESLEEEPQTEIEQTGQSAELLKGSEAPDDAVDMGDWEPTLF